jgi:phthiocerol/phenolphthiocerol synthesis type-I polyketide synthase E
VEGMEIAVVGMAGRFPGARNVAELWRNLRAGVESVSFFSEAELEASGVDLDLLRQPNYVRAAGWLEDVDLFDASFFGFNAREAEITDPQQRVFLECAWEALEDAGCDPEKHEGSIGVYAGCGLSAYLFDLYANRRLMELVGNLPVTVGNDKDFLASRVSYKLNLTGPALAVQTACSTSLAAVHVACQELLAYQCDTALAGGVSFGIRKEGYLYQAEGIFSPDGHCRAFDAEAAGTVPGGGVGAVVLKRLADALAGGDHVRAVIKGSALNNDGSSKIGYTAPSVGGQADAVAMAHAAAGVAPDTITYLEAHGTGTPLGDPIEVTALTRAFRAGTDRTGFCAIGSVKTNVGHLNAAAGIAGLIKTVLALEHRELPPSLHFRTPNPAIDFAGSPFSVNTALTPWEAGGRPRRAAVNSVGLGGTNVHVVLEEAPAVAASPASRPWQLLVLSARTETALEAVTSRLAGHLRERPGLGLADVAGTLQAGRWELACRRVAVCRDLEDAAEMLASPDRGRLRSSSAASGDPPVVFLFPGGGAQHAGMGSELYRLEPAFRAAVDRCAGRLAPRLGLDIRDAVRGERGGLAGQLARPSVGLPALFATEYALAALWASWGIRPSAMAGHSLGEYVAACLADVLSLEDALALVAERGRLFEELPAGAMLGVALTEAEVAPLLGDGLSLAAVNGPAHCVLSGQAAAVHRAERALTARGVECRRLQIEVAAHSEMVRPILDRFADFVATLELRAPRVPYLSNVTGTWVTEEQARDPGCWAAHLRQTVRFSENARELFAEPDRVLLEVGPGRTLASLVGRHPDRPGAQAVVASMRHPDDARSDREVLLEALGRLWLAGARPDWSACHGGERPRRTPLPTYPFERRRYWVGPGAEPASAHRGHHAELARHPRPDLGQVSYAAPGDELEAGIAAIWRDLFGIEELGVHDNFFELNGNSLMALRATSRVRDAFQVDLPLRSFFQAPTVADLAALVRALRAQPDDDRRRRTQRKDEARLARIVEDAEAAVSPSPSAGEGRGGGEASQREAATEVPAPPAPPPLPSPTRGEGES